MEDQISKSEVFVFVHLFSPLWAAILKIPAMNTVVERLNGHLSEMLTTVQVS